jgi:Uma2 family endonuclease
MVMTAPARISLPQYELMIQHGVFDGRYHQRVELVRGEIRQMNPIGIEHATAVNVLNEWSIREADRRRVLVSVQNPIFLPDSDSAPEPDVAWLVRKRYTSHPLPEDVLLVIEVADTTLAEDREEKAPLYAEAGIAEYWVVNLIDKCVEVFRDPVDGAYRRVDKHAGDAAISPSKFPDLALRPGSVFEG